MSYFGPTLSARDAGLIFAGGAGGGHGEGFEIDGLVERRGNRRQADPFDADLRAYEGRDGNGLVHRAGGDGEMLNVDQRGDAGEGALEGGHGRGGSRGRGGGGFQFGFQIGNFFFEHGDVVFPVAAHVGAAHEQDVGVDFARFREGLPGFEGFFFAGDRFLQCGGILGVAIETMEGHGGSGTRGSCGNRPGPRAFPNQPSCC